MGLFNKNKKGVNQSSSSSGVPALPELPKLPELPQLPPAKSNQGKLPPRPNALPRFPSNSLGDKFSQNTIKDAVSGEKEDDNVVDEFEHDIQRMPQLPDHPRGKEIMTKNEMPPYEKQISHEGYRKPVAKESSPSTMRAPSGFTQRSQTDEPVFIRLDKFEESMDTFDKIKKQVSGVSKLLDEVRDIKDREEKELQEWQGKIEMIKNQIEKIDRDIFSKI